MRITFKQYLLERISSHATLTPVDIDNATEFMKTYCRDGMRAIANGGVLFRGFGRADIASNKTWTKVDTSTLKRTSRDTNNVYQLMMNKSSRMKGFSSRESSMFCSSSFTAAQTYTLDGKQPYVVIPEDGTELVVSSHADFILSPFENDFGFKNLDSFSTFIGRLFDFLGKPDNEFSEWDDISDIEFEFNNASAAVLAIRLNMELMWQLQAKTAEAKKAINDLSQCKSADDVSRDLTETLQELLNNGQIELDSGIQKFYNLLVKGGKNKLQVLCDEVFTPDNLGLDIQRFGDPIRDSVSDTNYSGSREIWFSGKAYIIPLVAFKEIVNQLLEEDHPVNRHLLHTVNEYA